MITSASELMEAIFGDARGELSPGQIIARGVVVYVAGVILVRLGKSRMLGRASPLDLILAFVLGSLLSRGINGSATLTGTIAASVTLVVLHWAFTALSYRYHWCGTLIKGHTYTLISDGEINWDNLRRSHISEHDLHEEMRLNANIDEIGEVKLAVKERSGEVGVVPKTAEPRVVDIEVREGVQTVRVILS